MVGVARGSEPEPVACDESAVVWAERGSKPEGVVGSVSRAEVAGERRPSTGEEESMALSSSSAEFGSESESVRSFLRRFFPGMGKWFPDMGKTQRKTQWVSSEKENQW